MTPAARFGSPRAEPLTVVALRTTTTVGPSLSDHVNQPDRYEDEEAASKQVESGHCSCRMIEIFNLSFDRSGRRPKSVKGQRLEEAV